MGRDSMRLPFAIVSVVTTLCLSAHVARAESPRRVAIIPQLAVNVDDRRVVALTEELAETLHQRLVVDAIGGVDVSRRLPTEGLPDDCLVQKACVDDLGVRLDADELIFVVLVQVGQDIQVDATWIDVATGRSASRPRLVLDAEARAGTVFGEAATRLLPDAEVRSRTVVVSAPRARPRRMTTPAWITAGTGGALLATGVVFGVMARGTYNRCERDRDCSDDELDTMERHALTADVTVSLAIGAGIATGVLWWLSGGESEPVVGVGAAPGTATITYGGRF